MRQPRRMKRHARIGAQVIRVVRWASGLAF